MRIIVWGPSLETVVEDFLVENVRLVSLCWELHLESVARELQFKVFRLRMVVLLFRLIFFHNHRTFRLADFVWELSF